MIVDSSALLAIILREAEAEVFEALILGAESPRMSVASYFEVALKLDGKPHGLDPELDRFVEALAIELVPVTTDQAHAARLASVRFGRQQPAKLNFGDCLTYALAKTSNKPLLFKGNDFSQTDLALVRLGSGERTDHA